jgi:hypothetical protein
VSYRSSAARPKELARVIAGRLIAPGITIWVAIYMVDHFIAPHDPTDLLGKAGLL